MRFPRHVWMVAILVVTVGVWPGTAVAEEEHSEHAEAVEHAEGAEEHGEAHPDYKNGLALFLGVTDEPGHGTDGTVGLEYTYELSERWGIGGILDYAGPDQRNLVVAPAVFWSPWGGGLTFLAAPGVEFHNGRGEAEHHLLKSEGDEEGDPDETFFVMRFGVAYWFHVGSRYGIAPAVDLDLVDGEEVWVYGVNFEVKF